MTRDRRQCPGRNAPQNVRFGSKADITSRPRHFRFSPNSRHSSVQVECRLGARSELNSPNRAVAQPRNALGPFTPTKRAVDLNW